jgi:hypothetical protein
VSAAAAGAVIRFVIAVDDVVATLGQRGDKAAAAGLQDVRRHTPAPSKGIFDAPTPGRSEKFHGFSVNEPSGEGGFASPGTAFSTKKYGDEPFFTCDRSHPSMPKILGPS